MGYGKKIYEEARAQLEQSRREAEDRARLAAEAFYQKCPEAREIKDQMGANAARAARAVVSGGDVRAGLMKLRDRGMALQAQYEELLKQQGLTPQDIKPRYACPLCGDTGFTDGRMCQCLKRLQRDLAYEALNMNAPLGKSTFEGFSLDY